MTARTSDRTVPTRIAITHSWHLKPSLQPTAYQRGELAPFDAASGELHGSSHDGPHIPHARCPCLVHGPVHYLFELLLREGFRQVGADDLRLSRLRRRPLLAPGERSPRLYLGVLERGTEHPQSADAGPVTLLHGGFCVALYPVRYGH